MKRVVRIVFFLLVMIITGNTTVAGAGSDYETARKYYHSGRYSEAVRHLQNYITQKPDASAYYMMGYALYKLKRFDEANEYFRDAYLIDPTFTPAKDAGTGDQPKKTVRKLPKRTGPAEAPTLVAKQQSSNTQPPAPQAVLPGVGSKQPAAPLTPAVPQSPIPLPSLPKSGPDMPAGGGALVAIPMLMGGLFAGFTLMFLGLSLAFYLFFSYCLYRIATKLNCPAAWTAWVPLLNMWPVVGSAGKPWWWLILLFIPLVGIIIWIYLWMCIAENLGKNKWIALLLQITGIGYLILSPWLAFSKEAVQATPVAGELE